MTLPLALRGPARKLMLRNKLRSEETGFPLQVGALAFREGPQVMLVTRKGGGPWIIPKGWPMRGKSLAEAAAQEAWEEAGVVGRLDGREIGHFDHCKNHDWVGPLRCTIRVYPLEVSESLGEWPEKGLRERRWFDRDEALRVLDSAELRDIIENYLGP